MLLQRHSAAETQWRPDRSEWPDHPRNESQRRIRRVQPEQVGLRSAERLPGCLDQLAERLEPVLAERLEPVLAEQQGLGPAELQALGPAVEVLQMTPAVLLAQVLERELVSAVKLT